MLYLFLFQNDSFENCNKHDFDALDKMLPADLVITFQDGEVLTKDKYIAPLKKIRATSSIFQYRILGRDRDF